MGIPKQNQSPGNLFFQVRQGEKIVPGRMIYYISDPPDGLFKDSLCQKLSDSYILRMNGNEQNILRTLSINL